jgi:hypothetical protein
MDRFVSAMRTVEPVLENDITEHILNFARMEQMRKRVIPVKFRLNLHKMQILRWSGVVVSVAFLILFVVQQSLIVNRITHLEKKMSSKGSILSQQMTDTPIQSFLREDSETDVKVWIDHLSRWDKDDEIVVNRQALARLLKMFAILNWRHENLISELRKAYPELQRVSIGDGLTVQELRVLLKSKKYIVSYIRRFQEAS